MSLMKSLKAFFFFTVDFDLFLVSSARALCDHVKDFASEVFQLKMKILLKALTWEGE